MLVRDLLWLTVPGELLTAIGHFVIANTYNVAFLIDDARTHLHRKSLNQFTNDQPLKHRPSIGPSKNGGKCGNQTGIIFTRLISNNQVRINTEHKTGSKLDDPNEKKSKNYPKCRYG